MEHPDCRGRMVVALLARLDEGGFSHYCAYGEWGLAGTTAHIVDSGLRALERTGDPYPKS